MMNQLNHHSKLRLLPHLYKGIFFIFLLSNPTLAQFNTLLAVSKPPVPVLTTDPAQGLIFKTPLSLASAAPIFDTQGAPVSLEYLDFHNGNAFITFDDGPTPEARGGVMVLEDFMGREGETFDAARDYLITGAQTGLLEPKDLVVVEEANVIIVADFAGKDIRVFDLAATGDAAPMFITTILGTTQGSVWSVDFDAANNRLFVSTTIGTVLVYDDFLETRGGNGPDRVMTPVMGGAKASANFHEILYIPERDMLFVVDVGEATTTSQEGFDNDGMIWVLENASSADGDVAARARIVGNNTQLGNPVGIDFDGSSLYVAEKAKSLVLRFDDVLTLTGDVNLAPSAAVTVVEPESVVLAPHFAEE
jgi:hypothetical protein